MSTVTRKRRAGTRGFTLVETLAAMTLFALAAAAISSMAVTATRRTTENRHAMSAAFIAQREMEHLRGLDYASLVSESLSVPLGGQTFTVNSVVTPDAPVLNVKTVVVTVTWTGPEGSKSYAITTYYTDVTA